MSVVTILPECKPALKITDTPISQKSRTSSKSLDSMFSSGSSKFSMLHRRKMNHRGYRDRGSSLIPAVSEVKQRVISAKVLRVKQIQNQLAEAHLRINELTNENRLLQSLHKRQDSALSKYENSSAELPKLLHSHAEEIRMWQTRARAMQRQNKELHAKLKQKDTLLLTLSDQNKHLSALSREKNLEEREKLQDRVRDLESRLIEKDSDLKLLARRLQLEAKAHRSNLQIEQAKYRELLTKIELAEFLHDEKEKRLPKSNFRQIPRFKSPSRHPLSSKSASSLHTNHDKVALILPPCEGQETKRPTKENETNSPKIKTKIQINSESDNGEIDLSRNNHLNREKLAMMKNVVGPNNHHHVDDQIKATLTNGHSTNHKPKQLISQKPKIFSKIQPLQMQQLSHHEKKSSIENGNHSDDILNIDKVMNNATKELFEHKMHINELEAKLELRKKVDPLQYDETSSSSSSFSLSSSQEIFPKKKNFGKLPGHSFDKDIGDHDFSKLNREMRESNVRRESLLDELCDAIVDSKLNKRNKKPEAHVHINGDGKLRNVNNHEKMNGKVQLDPKEKNKLLAVLKNIDDES